MKKKRKNGCSPVIKRNWIRRWKRKDACRKNGRIFKKKERKKGRYSIDLFSFLCQAEFSNTIRPIPVQARFSYLYAFPENNRSKTLCSSCIKQFLGSNVHTALFSPLTLSPYWTPSTANILTFTNLTLRATAHDDRKRTQR